MLCIVMEFINCLYLYNIFLIELKQNCVIVCVEQIKQSAKQQGEAVERSAYEYFEIYTKVNAGGRAVRETGL